MAKFINRIPDVKSPPASGGGISIDLNISQAGTALMGLANEVDDRRVPNRQLSIQLYGWVIRNFQHGGADQRPPWLPLKESTLKRKKKDGYSSLPLIRKGNLRQSFAPFADATQAGVGAQASFGVDYARVHETGSIKRPGQPPRRSMLPPNDYALNAAVQIYNLHITKARRRAGL